MSRKKYSDEAVNELADSVFFRKPPAPPPLTTDSDSPSTDPLPAEEPSPTTEPNLTPIIDRASVRTPVRTTAIRRTKTRYAFEFFQDQLDQLKQYSLDEQVRGEAGNMSAMVREALDTYITKRDKGK